MSVVIALFLLITQKREAKKEIKSMIAVEPGIFSHVEIKTSAQILNKRRQQNN